MGESNFDLAMHLVIKTVPVSQFAASWQQGLLTRLSAQETLSYIAEALCLPTLVYVASKGEALTVWSFKPIGKVLVGIIIRLLSGEILDNRGRVKLIKTKTNNC